MMTKHIDKLFYPVMLSVLSGIILILTMLIVGLLPFRNVLVRLTLPILLALVVFPFLIDQC